MTMASTKKSPASESGMLHGPRAARGAKATSTASRSTAGGGSKVAGPVSRFLEFAGACDAGAAEIETAAAAQPHVPGLRSPVSRAEQHRSAMAGYATEAARTASIDRAIGTLRGQPKPATAVKHDTSTPEGVAAHALAVARRVGTIR